MAESESVPKSVANDDVSNTEVSDSAPGQAEDRSESKVNFHEGFYTGPEHPNQMCITKKLGSTSSFQFEQNSSENTDSERFNAVSIERRMGTEI